MTTLRKPKMPQALLIYVYDYEGNEPLYAAVESLGDIPEDAGNFIGVYTLNRVARFKVRRELN